MSLKNNIGIVTIIFLFLFTNFIFLSFYSDIWWDSSVYIGMGKYIYSLGQSGLWEESRPLILPLIIGLGWHFNLNIIYFGRIVSIVFAVLVLFITYKIGIKLFSKKVSLLAVFFIAFSYTFLFFSSNMLTEIPSTFFFLLAFYFFLSNRFFLIGLFSGIAIMTRIFQVFTLIGLVSIFILQFYKKPNFARKSFYFAVGASIFILPYFLLNYYSYNDIFLPLKIQAHLTKTSGWEHFRGFDFYFTNLLKENFFMLFLIAIPFFFKKNYKFYALLLISLLYLLILSFAKHKEMRFIIAILPFLYLSVSYCLMQIYNNIKYNKLTLVLFFIVIGIWLTLTFSSIINISSFETQREDEGFLYFQNYLKNNKGNIWITNPLYALYSDEKIEGLLYFYSPTNLISFVNKNKEDVDIILFNNCDIKCPPFELEPLCEESRRFLASALSKFNIVYQKEVKQCKYQIYRVIS